jgi:hypothetical protein
MKRLLLIAFVFGFSLPMTAQVTFRNDFVINAKARKIKNKGITLISINLSRHTSWNYLLNGRGGNVLSIDVDALKNRKRNYSYSELAERIYVPIASTLPVTHPVPLFLLLPPPKIKMPMFYHRHLVYQ